MKDNLELMELPVYREDVDRWKSKRIRKYGQTNVMQESILEFMAKFKLKDVDMVNGTGIPWGTYYPIITGETEAPLADKNLLRLWQFMNKFAVVPLHWLLFGIGDMEPLPEKEDQEKAG
jgi:hypothetical protein